MAADGTVGVKQSPSADRLIDNDKLTVSGSTVYRQRTRIGGDAAGDLAGVTSAKPASSAFGVVTRPVDDFDSFEAQHITLTSTDRTVTFAQAVRAVRVSNWDTTNRVLVKDGSIASTTDVAAARVGRAPTTDVPASRWFPFATTTIHLRSANGVEVSVEGYYGSA